jgi:chaperonin GroES
MPNNDQDMLEPFDNAGDQAAAVENVPLIEKIAQSEGDISSLLDEATLTTLGANVVRDYEIDESDREEWKKGAEDGLKRAAQERIEAENPPPYRRSFVNYPILTVAAQQFNARAYPAICKTGSIVKCKVIGSDKGRPIIAADGTPAVMLDGEIMSMGQAQDLLMRMQANGMQIQPPQPAWQIKPGDKQRRADRVADYLNIYIEFRMDDWEEDTDDLLMQIPVVGCGFRKIWWDASEAKECAAFVSAMDLVVPTKAKSLETAPRITELMHGVFPFQIRERIASGFYRDVTLPQIGEDEEEPRLLLEQHRLADLDDDGVDEPYIITVDKETQQVLRIEAAYGPDDVEVDRQGMPIRINRKCYYVKYPFLPSFKGGFYNMGFGHLLEQLSDIINTCINQTFDAGFAQIAGGGFIAAGLRLQGDKRPETMRWMPGEYKQVNVASGDLRAGIVERTFPSPSPIIFNLLEMMLGAAKDITSVKDVMTGEAKNTAPVGTTLALIEQGLSVFTAIYKRVYRSLGKEFCLIRDDLATYGGKTVAQDYDQVLDDPQADFAKDFADSDMDIKPVADPTSVTKMQQMAKAQFLLGMRGVGLNDMEINRRALETAGIEDIEALMPQGQPQPDPLMMAKVRRETTAADLNIANAQKAAAQATELGVKIGTELGQSDAGSIPGMAGASGNGMGLAGLGGAGGSSEGGMGQL